MWRVCWGCSPFSSGVVVEGDKQKWTVCNICTPQMESWGIKSANLFSNYTIPPNDLQIGLDLLEPSKSHAGLESLTLNVRLLSVFTTAEQRIGSPIGHDASRKLMPEHVSQNGLHFESSACCIPASCDSVKLCVFMLTLTSENISLKSRCAHRLPGNKKPAWRSVPNIWPRCMA